MNGLRTPLLVGLTIVIGACGTRAARDTGTPAVHELARLESIGQLDQDRLACVIPALVPASEAVKAQLEGMNEAEAAVMANAAHDHARSVQDGMRASEVMAIAERRAGEMRRAARYLDAQGDWAGAARAQSWAMEIEQYAREQGDIFVRSDATSTGWTDEEASLLVEYATLRALRAESEDPPAEVLARIAEIEDEDPKVMNGYAALLLGFYRDPDLPCSEG